MRIAVAILSWPVLGGLGALLGCLIGLRAARGVDPIVHPMLWTTPLGAFLGLAIAAMIVVGMAISKK